MNLDFTNKVVVVTGSTRGIGRGIAEEFAQSGAQVIIIGRTQSNVDEVVKNISAQGLAADGFACNITDANDVQETINKILDKHKRIDILVNNAGVTRDNLLLRMSESDWDEVITTNLKGVFLVSKVVSKVMLKAKQGKMINIASIIGITGNVGQSNYAASKAGVIAFTKSLAKELASRQITVNCIAPGYIKTDMTEQMTEEARDKIQKSIPINRLGEVSDVAGICLFLASDRANFITGQTLVIDGGMAI